jgi:hypothetical protein
MSEREWQRVAGPGAVEFQRLAGGGMRFRSAADPDAGTLAFSASQVQKFRQGVHAGEFDLPDKAG